MRFANWLTLTLSCLLVCFASGTARGALLANWKFENNLLDSSGNGNHLSVGTGTASYGAPAPTLGTTASFNFNGSTRLEDTTPSAGLGFTGPYTVAAWVQSPLPNASGYHAVFGRGAPGDSDLEIYVQKDTNDLVVVHDRDNGNPFNGFQDGDPLNNTYFHLAVTYTGSGWTLYYNGVSQAFGTFGTPDLNLSAGYQIWVGQFNHAHFAPTFMNGLIDEMWVYDQALTQAQLDNLIAFNNIDGPPVPEPSTLTLLGLGLVGIVRQSRRRRMISTNA